MTYQMGMHTLQRLPDKVEREALDFMQFMWQIVLSSNCDWRYILNMDQTPLYFLMNAKCTLELILERMVHICMLSDDTKQVTVAVTIVADGMVLPSMPIFKGQPSECIAKTEFATYPATHRYQCQANAWMDEVCMIAWVNEVLAPYIAMAPDEVVPLLVILNSYQCHMMALVVQMIQELGVEVKHIPGGCTPLCQPINVGFNKQIKDCMRRQWMLWVMSKGITHGTTSQLVRLDVAKWVDNAMGEMRREVEIVQNAWKKTGYEWFVNEDGGEWVVGGIEEEFTDGGLVGKG
jgi:hypothetical protein